jgi:NAD(P)-dependent dehydrogenase (short-subunit alcohol dehydrogenase family)
VSARRRAGVKPETVLITGCSSGIGRATARAFLDEDWIVYATARNPADIETLGEAGCELATLDVTDQGDVERVVDRIVDEEGKLDCLVNNAGYAQFGPTEDVPTDAVDRQFDVNVNGPHRLTRAVLPHMREQESGTVVNVSSVAGRIAFPAGGAYCGSKFALEAMTDALRNEVAEYGIDAVLVEPGPVETQFTDRADDQLDELDRSGAYGSLYGLFEDSEALGGGGPGAIPPERVAEDILDAASSTKPPARYPSGTVARIAVLGRFLPDVVQDSIWRFLKRLV